MAEIVESSAEAEPSARLAGPWIPYVVPMAAFCAITAVEPQLHAWYPIVYVIKVVVVTVCLLLFRGPLSEIRFDSRYLTPGVLVGAAVFAEWVWLEPLTHYPHFAILGKRAEYNPFASIDSTSLRMVFLAARFYGLALLIPMVEEIFWRSFLLRVFTDPDHFDRLRVGEYSWRAFCVVAVAFGAAHQEWLEAIICAAAYGLLLRKTRSLFACVLAHSVTNLMLGIYIVTQHAWRFW